jgi:hypothetical protein
MGWQRCCILAVLLLLIARSADAGVLPVATASLTVDGGQPIPIAVTPIVEDGKTMYAITQAPIITEGFMATFSGAANPDPVITYGLGITDFGAPSTFSFTFTSPIVPTGPGTVASAYVSGGLNNVSGPGVTITPTAGPLVQVASVSSGGPFVNLGVDVGPAQSGVGPIGAHYPYPLPPASTYSAGPVAGPVGGPWTALSVTAAFSLTGGGDSVGLTGLASVVPEPSTWLLVVGGGFTWLTIRTRRRKHSV